MSLNETKFYFYKMWALGEDKNEVNLPELYDKKLDQKNNPSRTLKTPSGISYDILINKEQRGFWGRTYRCKDKSEYFAKSYGDEAEELPFKENKVIGEKKKDVVQFVFSPTKNSLIFLMESGYQTPGMPTIIHYFKEIFPELEFDYKAFTIKKTPKLKTLFSRKLKRMVFRFKKNPQIPKQLKYAEDTLKRMAAIEEYSIKIEATVVHNRKKLKKAPIVNDLFSKFFGIDLESAINSGVDFISFLNNFQVETYENDSEIVKDDILDLFEQKTFKINKLSFSDFKSIKSKLFDALEERPGEN